MMNRRGALTGVELRLLAFELAVGAGDRHPLAGAHPQQIDFEFRERREDVEEALADWIVGVIHRAPKRQADTAGGERVADRACVWDRACEPVELRNDERVASRTAASACSRPGRARLRPVTP